MNFEAIEKIFACNKVFDSSSLDDILEQDRMMDDIISPEGERTIYQCPECGVIYIEEDSGKLSAFLPEDDKVSKNLLKVNKIRHKKS